MQQKNPNTSKNGDFTPVLHAKGLKATPIRLAILSVLSGAPTPLSIASIASSIQKTADQATLYRNASTLKDAGIITEVHLEHGHAHYEIRDKHHHHIVCVDCGVTRDITPCVTDSMKGRALNESGFDSVSRHSMEFFGLCKTCAEDRKQRGVD